MLLEPNRKQQWIGSAPFDHIIMVVVVITFPIITLEVEFEDRSFSKLKGERRRSR